MKKLAITLSLTTLLLGGLFGCGNNEEGTSGLGTQDQRGMGYHTTDREPGTGITGQRAGEGPITDMFTRDDDDQRGARGFGRDTRQPATGLAGQRGLTGQRDTLGNDGRSGVGAGGTGQGAGMHGTQFGGAAGRGGMTGAAGQDAGLKRSHEGLIRTRERGDVAGGARTGMRGTRFGDVGGRGGMTGAGNGTRGLGDNTDIGFRDQGGAGIVGNRAGYVDDRGILRRRGTTGHAGIGGLGQTGKTLQGNRTGLGTDKAGQTGDRGIRGTGMNQSGYHTGYDAATVQRITTRLADVENVKDSRVIVDNDRILIGVDANGQNSQRIEQDVRRTVENMVGDKEVIIVTERDQYNQVRSADDRLRGGEAFEEVGATVNEMFRDFGRAIQRPFERTR